MLGCETLFVSPVQAVFSGGSRMADAWTQGAGVGMCKHLGEEDAWSPGTQHS